jgi:hypothetical protein
MKFKNIPKTYSKKYHFSQNILDLASSNFDKLRHLISEIKEGSKCIVFTNGFYYEYFIKSFKEEGVTQIKIRLYSKNIVCHIYHNSDTFRLQLPDELIEQNNNIASMCKEIICIELFTQYSEITTKILPPNRQIWDGINCLYNNKTQSDINIVDLTWFTTLIKSDGFKVRGHFRLQPCGEGMKDRKLIWINEFQKEGYNREAKILHQSI